MERTRKPSRGETIINENREWIAEQRKAGKSWDAIAQELGVGHFTILVYRDPVRYEMEKERKRKQREAERRAEGVEAKRPRTYRKLHEPTERNFQVLGELPPPDTRDLTARLLGDPLPGRSYLDRMRQQQGDAHG